MPISIQLNRMIKNSRKTTTNFYIRNIFLSTKRYFGDYLGITKSVNIHSFDRVVKNPENVGPFPRTISRLTKMASRGITRVDSPRWFNASCRFTLKRSFDRLSRSRRWIIRAVDDCKKPWTKTNRGRRSANISNVPRNGKLTLSSSPLSPFFLRISLSRTVTRSTVTYTSVTLSLTKLAFTYASSIVRWVWKCPGHSGTMLSAVAVLAPGNTNTTDTEAEPRHGSLYIGPRQLPHYSRWPMANRIGEVPTVTLRGRSPRHRRPAWKSSSCGSDEPPKPVKALYVEFCLFYLLQF